MTEASVIADIALARLATRLWYMSLVIVGVGISFAGEVAYARMLHEVVADEGIHVAHNAVAGQTRLGMP